MKNLARLGLILVGLAGACRSNQIVARLSLAPLLGQAMNERT